jgi:hypothetical protein
MPATPATPAGTLTTVTAVHQCHARMTAGYHRRVTVDRSTPKVDPLWVMTHFNHPKERTSSPGHELIWGLPSPGLFLRLGARKAGSLDAERRGDEVGVALVPAQVTGRATSPAGYVACR